MSYKQIQDTHMTNNLYIVCVYVCLRFLYVFNSGVARNSQWGGVRVEAPRVRRLEEVGNGEGVEIELDAKEAIW